MVDIRVSGEKKAVDAFMEVIKDLVQNNNVTLQTNNTESYNLDFTIRKYISLHCIDVKGDIKEASNRFTVLLRIASQYDDEVVEMLEILKKVGVVYYKTVNGGDISIRMRDEKYTAVVSCSDRATAVTRKMLGIGDRFIKVLE